MQTVEAASSQLWLFMQQRALADDLTCISSRNQLNFFTNSRENPTDQIFIFFSDEKSVGVKTMRKFVYVRPLYPFV